MNHPIRDLVAWMRQPDYKDPDKNLSALYIQAISSLLVVVASIIGLVYAFYGQLFYVLMAALEILIYGIVITLVRSGKLRVASNLFLISALGMLSYGIFIAGGIHASSSLMFPVILVFASLLLDRRSFVFYGLLCIVTIGFIIYAENQGLMPVPYVPDPPKFPLFITYSLIVVTSGIVIRLITESLQNSSLKARTYAQEIIAQKSMLDRVGQAVVACQMDSTIVYWNQAAMDLYGWKAEEVVGRNYYDVVPTQLTPEIAEAIRVVLRRGEVWSGELVVQKRDGKSLPVIGSIAPLRGETGLTTGWIGVAADLSERAKAEEIDRRRTDEMSLLYRLGISLTSGKNLYDTLLALQAEIIKLIQADAFYVAIYDEETDIVKYPIFFDEGSPFDEASRLLHEWPGLTGAVVFSGKTLYLQDMFDPEVEEVYHPHETNDLILHTFLGIPLNVDGHILGMLSVQSKIVDAYTPDQIQLMENIAVQAATAIARANLLDKLNQELAERKRAEEQLREREVILESVTYAAEEFLKTPDWRANIDLVLERLGKTLTVTHAYLFEDHINEQGEPVTSMRYEWTAPGYPSDLGGEYFQNSIIHQEGFEDQVETLRRGDARIGNFSTFSPIEKESMELFGIKSILEVPIFVNGKEWGAIGFDDFEKEREWTIAEVDALKIAAGVLGAAIKRQADEAVLQNELNERKKLINELENKNSELERFTYTVSHDLKSPLVTINGFLGYLEQDAASGNMDRMKRDVQRIHEAVKKMQRLLSELLELSRIGRMMNPPETLSFEDLAREAMNIVQGRLEERGVTVRIQPNLPSVCGDRPRLVEVLQNLLDNAAKYMGYQPDPCIEIGQAGVEDDKLVFFVKDNGLGISSEHHERIFGLFNKLDAKSDGTGVGLALVKRIVEVHGGRIWVKSEEGMGSTFFFTLASGSSKS